MSKKKKNILSLIAIAGGYKVIDVTQKIHDAFQATPMSSYIDGLASGRYHRVVGGHDFLFNAKSIYEKFGITGLLKDYPIELSKDFLSKSGIPLPGVQGLVNAGIVSHKVGTEWLSLNAADVFTGGLSIYSTYKLHKKLKNGKCSKKDVLWISVGIGVKLTAGTIKHNPVLIVSGLADTYLLISNEDARGFIKDIMKTAIPIGIISASVGAGAAGAVTAGVGAFGTASTGAAITGLSGAAATNATLAWLGGGSIAAGGLGVAGGTVVLTGGASLVALGAGALTYKILKKNTKAG